MHTMLLILGLVSLLASSSPLVERAGAPIPKSVPAECTLINPLPHIQCGTGKVSGWMPDKSFFTTHFLYQSRFDDFQTPTEQDDMCEQQCYGFGTPGECKSFFHGLQIPTQPQHTSTEGGDLVSMCLLFSEYADPNTFVPAPRGQYLDVTAANIFCPM